MKVTCDREALLEAVNGVVSVVAARSPSLVMQCVRLTAADGRLALAATDLEVGLRLVLEQVDVEEDGEALIPADKLAQIVRSSTDPSLSLRTDGTTLHIKGADAHFTIYGFEPREAPPVRDFDASADVDSTIAAGVLRRLATRTLFAASTEHVKYAFNGVLFERKGRQLRFVATDGRRLAVAKGQCDSGEGESLCIIPTKALNLVVRLVEDEAETIRVAIDDNQALLAIGDRAVISTNFVEGTFPPFEDVIPKDQDKKITSNVDVLASAIRRAALLTNQESRGVRMQFDKNRLVLRSRAPEMGEAEISVDLVYEGEPLEIGFNPGYLVDALKVIDVPEVTIELKSQNKPGILRAGSDFTYVVMPVQI